MPVSASIIINASKAAVWAATTDIANLAQLLSGVEKIEVVERPATGLVGLKWKETRMLFGKEATVEKWITEAKENEYYTTRAEQDGFVFITTNRVSGSDGSVVLTGIHETQAQGFAAKLKARPMVFFKGVIKKAIMQDVNDIKAAVEMCENVIKMLDDAASTPQPDEVESAVTCAHRVGVREEFVPSLLKLLLSKNHFRHEDIVSALQDIKDPRAVDGLFNAALVSHEYMVHDEFFGLARKCTWALADIGTPEARKRLEQLAVSENALIAGYARKRLIQWSAEKHRKIG